MLSLDKAYELVNTKYINSNPKRLEHILGVAKMAKKLAKIYCVDEEKAEIAGLMHDYIKYESIEEMKTLIDDIDQYDCSICEVLHHSYASANVYKKLGGEDLDIYNAIRNHVFGRLNMSKLEEIILIADYTEETRKYKDCIKCREILFEKGLYEAIYFSTEKTIKFVLDRGLEPHPTQLDVLNYYKGLIK
jgi:predicted HD superfamily hydrolase involved in NAD metabolism